MVSHRLAHGKRVSTEGCQACDCTVKRIRLRGKQSTSRNHKLAYNEPHPAIQLPIRTFVINLVRRVDRWKGVRARLARLVSSTKHRGCLSIERLLATDGLLKGSVCDTDVGRHWTTDRNSKYDGRPGSRPGVYLQMTPGERGCAFSHVRIWRKVAACDATQPVLVLEDDAVPVRQFVAHLTSAMNSAAADGADVVYLGHIQGAPWRRQVAPLLFEAEYLWTTVAYLLWPRGAQTLLSELPVDQPVDNFMAWLIATRRMKALAVDPPIVEQEEEWDCGNDVPHSDDVVVDS